jgi:hypothetical protein
VTDWWFWPLWLVMVVVIGATSAVLVRALLYVYLLALS